MAYYRAMHFKEANNMKKRTIICVFLIIVCLGAFFGYLAFDRIRTDTKAPEISVPEANAAVSVFDPESALLAGVTAKDNRDGDVTDSLVVENIKLTAPDGAIRVSIAAFDGSGNVAKTQREMQYADYMRPTFILEAPLNFVQNTTFEVLDVIGATDALDGDISHRVRATSLTDSAIATLGTHDVEFTVTNSLGDTVKLILPVEIYPAGTYSAKLELTDYLIYLPRGSAFNARSYLSEFSAGTQKTDLTRGVPADLTLEIDGTVNTQKEGVYSVGYTVSSTYYTAYSRLIVVVEG